MEESFQKLETLGQLLDLGFAVGLWNFFTQLIDLFFQIDISQQLLDGLGTHSGIEVVTKLFQRLVVLFVTQQLTLFQGGHAGIDNDVRFEVEYPLDITQGHVQQQTDTGRQGLQEPDVSYRCSQLDVSHALTTHFGQRNFYATLFTDNTTVLETLVLATQTLVVFDCSQKSWHKTDLHALA